MFSQDSTAAEVVGGPEPEPKAQGNKPPTTSCFSRDNAAPPQFVFRRSAKKRPLRLTSRGGLRRDMVGTLRADMARLEAENWKLHEDVAKLTAQLRDTLSRLLAETKRGQDERAAVNRLLATHKLAMRNFQVQFRQS